MAAASGARSAPTPRTIVDASLERRPLEMWTRAAVARAQSMRVHDQPLCCFTCSSAAIAQGVCETLTTRTRKPQA